MKKRALWKTKTGRGAGAADKGKTRAEIRGWMTDYLVKHLGLGEEGIDVERPLDEYGIDSAQAVRMIGDLEDYLGRELSPSLPYRFPTIEALSTHLAEPANA
ncbi:MAG TPA: acyl carrier protein [Stellaceae bacterium]|nr:acyl carrier protein [Stellaceae bacterium]